MAENTGCDSAQAGDRYDFPDHDISNDEPVPARRAGYPR